MRAFHLYLLLSVTVLGFVFLAMVPAVPADAADRDLAVRALEALQTEHPGARMHRADARTRSLYGAPMTDGATPDAAASAWLERHADVFGVPDLALALDRSHEIAHGRFTVFAYRQNVDGVPVEHSPSRILVQNGSPHRVVYAAARIVSPPEGGFPEAAIDGATALSKMRATESFGALVNWTSPEAVVFQGEGDVELDRPVLTWKFGGWKQDADGPEGYTFFVSAADGSLVHLRDEVYHLDVEGHARANATPGTDPDIPENPPVERELPFVGAEVDGGAGVIADENGDFVIPHGGTDPVTVRGHLVGEWCHVSNADGPELVPEDRVTPPGPADLFFNDTPSENTTALANAFHWTTATHDFYKSRQPWFTGLDIPLATSVNRGGGGCNAFFFAVPLSINFLKATDSCPNTAYSSVIAHEYGHFVVYAHDLFQGAFGEGYSDSIAIMQLDDPVAGRKFMNGEDLRNIEEANKQYPCEGEIHDCGQVVAGCWWDTKKNLQTTLGDDAGLAFAQQLFIDWTEITLGGLGQDSAHPATVIEALVVDDDDANLGNGTPHFEEICAGFAAHNIHCEPLSAVLFNYPDGLPETLSPDHETYVRVVLSEYADTPVPDSAKLYYRIGAGQFSEVVLSEDAPNDYTATLPRVPCGEAIDFYFTAEATSEGTVSDPVGAPVAFHDARSTKGFSTIFEDDFEQDLGWTVDSTDLIRGEWERAVAQGLGFNGDPNWDYDGSGQCYLTSVDFDVDGGPTQLFTPQLPIFGTNPVIHFAYWHYSSNANDPFVVEIRQSAISPWRQVLRRRDGGGGWKTFSFAAKDYITPTNIAQVRFTYSDNPDNSIAEAAVDAFRIDDMDCSATAGFTLESSALVRGETAVVTATGAMPGTKVVFLKSRAGEGFGPCSINLGGLCVDILNPLRVGEAIADGAGIARYERFINPNAPLEEFAIQAVNKVGAPLGKDSTKSNVVVAPIVDP